MDRETGEQSQYRLVTDMLKGSLISDEKFDGILHQVEKLRKGFLEVVEKRRV